MTTLRTQQIRLNKDKVSKLNISKPIVAANTQDPLMKLNMSLQSTLNVSQLIELFATGIASQFHCDSISFTNDAEKISCNTAKSSRHYYSCRLVINDEVLGDIKATRQTPFTNDEIALFEELLCVLLYPLRNAIHYHRVVESAIQDPLTGALNRRAFHSHSARELALAKRHQSPFSLLALDLDHFKAINDNYGHPAGDAVLKCFAKELKKLVRETDLVFRTGGEEFIIMLGKTDQQGAALLASRICEAVAQLTCSYRNQTINFTTSIGVATFEDADTVETLVERADKALYKAKQNGRNQVF